MPFVFLCTPPRHSHRLSLCRHFAGLAAIAASLLAPIPISAADEEDTASRTPSRRTFVHHLDRAPNPERLKEYEGYKASIQQNGWTEHQQRALDEFAAKAVFPLYVSPEVLSPDSDGVELRKAIDQAERLHRAKSKTHNVVGDSIRGFRYELKSELEYAQSSVRLLRRLFERADPEWIPDEARNKLEAATSMGKEGHDLLRKANRQIDQRRDLENKLMEINRLTDRELTRQLNAGEIPNYKHYLEDGLRLAIRNWRLRLD